MESRRLMWLFVFIGGTAGSYLPALWGGETFSFTSIILGGIGGLLGIYLAFKINH
jgi:hypothetical protein